MTDTERLIIAELTRRLAVAIEHDDRTSALEHWADVRDGVPEYLNTTNEEGSTDA